MYHQIDFSKVDMVYAMEGCLDTPVDSIAMESDTAAAQKIGPLIKSLIPSGVEKTGGYGIVTKGSYGFQFWCYYKDGSKKQNYELEDEGKIDGTKMDEAFSKLADIVRQSPDFSPSQRSAVSFVISQGSTVVDIEEYDKSVGLHAIDKIMKKRLNLPK